MSKTAVNFLQALVAVVLGNAAYFLMVRYLPARAYHHPFHIDVGLLVDLWFCLLAFGLVKTIARKRKTGNPGR